MQQSETICVDIGNSGLRCARLQGDSLGSVLRLDWPVDFSADSGQQATFNLREKLDKWLEGRSAGRGWLVSSVQRTTEGHLRDFVRQRGEPYRSVVHSDLDIEVNVDEPNRVGIDRLLAAMAAMNCTASRPLIVIQAGSAITVDLVEAPRRFSGGAILPGVPMMLRLLSRAADLLPEVAADELFELPPLPGKNTASAMFAGTASAVVGGVQHLVARYRDRLGSNTPVLLSGGDGPRLAQHIPGPVEKVDQLVLKGLATVARS